MQWRDGQKKADVDQNEVVRVTFQASVCGHNSGLKILENSRAEWIFELCVSSAHCLV